MEESFCSKCDKFTVSIRQGRAHFTCNECGHDKTLSDVYFYEATHKTSNKNQHVKSEGKEDSLTKA